MRLVFAGTPEVAVPSLQALLDSDRHEVVAVVSRPDARTGRGRGLSHRLLGRVAHSLARHASIPVLLAGTGQGGRATRDDSPHRGQRAR